MSKTSEACALAEKWAADPIHGYDQTNRWGPDYDCSSFVTAVWDAVGVPTKKAGASYTGNMRGAFLRSGFEDVTEQVNLRTGKGLKGGDVLLNYRHHAAMMVSPTRLAQASINEKGTATGGKTGDQTGREVYVGGYYNYPWDCVLRYAEPQEEIPVEDSKETPCIDGLPTLRRGDKGETVRAAQFLLNGRDCSVGIWGADGDFGPSTEAAVLAFQRRNKLDDDGIIGPATWAMLLGVSK